jgi:hypothetical protein
VSVVEKLPLGYSDFAQYQFLMSCFLEITPQWVKLKKSATSLQLNRQSGRNINAPFCKVMALMMIFQTPPETVNSDPLRWLMMKIELSNPAELTADGSAAYEKSCTRGAIMFILILKRNERCSIHRVRQTMTSLPSTQRVIASEVIKPDGITDKQELKTETRSCQRIEKDLDSFLWCLPTDTRQQ